MEQTDSIHINLNALLSSEHPISSAVFETFEERDVYPFILPISKFLVKHQQPKGFPSVGPGKYDHDEKTSMYGILKAKLQKLVPPVKKIGDIRASSVPSPADYQKDWADFRLPRQSAKPFSQGSERNLNLSKPSYISPTTYNIDCKRNRKVCHHQAFGSAPVFLPEITIKSTIPSNTEKLYTTNEEQKYHQKLAYLKLYW